MRTQEVIEMATQSFYEDLVIDTPEKAAAIERMCANPEKYTYHCTGKLNFKWATDKFLQELMAPYIEKRDDSGDDDTERTGRPDRRTTLEQLGSNPEYRY